MSDLSNEYKIKYVDDKLNYIAYNRENKELFLSNDIEAIWNNEGKLVATFQNPRKNEPTFSDFVSDLFGKRSSENNSDCSIIF